MSELLNRLKKNSRIKISSTLSDSAIYGRMCEMAPTEVPMINVALSGMPDGGLSAGLTMIAGDSATFKTGFLIQLLKAFQAKHPDGICLFYDSEFGMPLSYLETQGINTDQILHCPITTVEELKFDIHNQMKNITDKDKVFIMVDSIGGLASDKEAQDAEDAKSVVDMTRAKALNSLFRIITPHLTIKNIPMVVINHVYETQEMYSKKVVSGGKKIYLACNDIWIMGKQQDKDGKELKGYYFVINIEKSRTCKAGSKILVRVTWEDGIDKNSGLFDEAIACGILQQSGAWYKVVDFKTGELSGNKRRTAIESDQEFFDDLIKFPDFIDHLREKYTLG